MNGNFPSILFVNEARYEKKFQLSIVSSVEWMHFHGLSFIFVVVSSVAPERRPKRGCLTSSLFFAIFCIMLDPINWGVVVGNFSLESVSHICYSQDHSSTLWSFTVLKRSRRTFIYNESMRIYNNSLADLIVLQALSCMTQSTCQPNFITGIWTVAYIRMFVDNNPCTTSLHHPVPRSQQYSILIIGQSLNIPVWDVFFVQILTFYNFACWAFIRLSLPCIYWSSLNSILTIQLQVPHSTSNNVIRTKLQSMYWRV